MIHSLSSQPLLPLLEIDPGILLGLILPLAGIALAGVVVVCSLYFQHRRREMWHETARVALEKGQPLPPWSANSSDAATGNQEVRNDLRAGFVLLGVGVGLFFFFHLMNLRPLAGIGAIPAFIGVALLLYSLLAAIFGWKHRAESTPPKS